MKEIEVIINLDSFVNIEKKSMAFNNIGYYIEIYLGANMVRSKDFKFQISNSDKDVLQINQKLILRSYMGNKLEIWFRNKENLDLIAYNSKNLSEILEEREESINLNLHEFKIGELICCFEVSERNLDKEVIIDKDEDLYKQYEEEEVEVVEEKEETESQKAELLKTKNKEKKAYAHITNMYKTNEPVF